MNSVIKPRYKNVLMTPRKAAQLLKKNKSNRRLRPGLVDDYARAMSAGRWMLNSVPIIVDDDGTLYDGQHRLHACIKADVDFWTAISYGISTEALDTIDMGKPRNAANVLEMAGIAKNHVLIAAVAKLALRYGGIRSPTPGEIKAEVLAKLDDYDSMAECVIGSRVSRVVSLYASSACGFCLMMLRHISKDALAADSFMRCLISGEDLNRTSPIFTIRMRAQKARDDRMAFRSDDQVTMIFKAWNAVRTNKRMTKVYPTGKGQTSLWRTIKIVK